MARGRSERQSGGSWRCRRTDDALKCSIWGGDKGSATDETAVLRCCELAGVEVESMRRRLAWWSVVECVLVTSEESGAV